MKEKFFVKVKDVLVFKQDLFLNFLEQKNYLNESYNKIVDLKFIRQKQHL
ncbi:site-specific DNA-methyltransferase [Schleiferia thermophila]